MMVGMGELEYRRDLFRGTAAYYDRFRPAYPSTLLDDLRARVPLGGHGRLLDLACGTGQVAFALAPDFDEVLAVDQEPEFVAFGTAKCERSGITNIRWMTGAAEEAALDGVFDLVTVGNAFHRLRRQVVADRSATCVTPHGCVALLWGGSPWSGPRPWQQAMDELLERWMREVEAVGRVPAGWREAMDADPHQRVLERAGFRYDGRFEFEAPHRWSIGELAGLVLSTSFLNREALGARVREFEEDLRTCMLSFSRTGSFEEDASFAYELARMTA